MWQRLSPNLMIIFPISLLQSAYMSFCDLPGVINVAELAEEAYLVDLIKNLIKEYIKAEDCINLLAVIDASEKAARIKTTGPAFSGHLHEVSNGAEY